MIKRTIYFGNPARLSTNNDQLVIDREENDKVTIPIEDIGYLILDDYGITVSKPLISRLLDNNVAIISTDDRHLPQGIILPLEGHSTQSETMREQIKATQALKKNLWKQTITAKIKNQSLLCETQGIPAEPLKRMKKRVKSGDPENMEGQASRYYWQRLFQPFTFKRERFGIPPNNVLNYGYAILRAVIARGLVSSGLLPMIGIHHRNRYNAYPLADDIMEPYRPVVDEVALNLVLGEFDLSDLTPDIKQELLKIPQIDVKMEGEHKPLMLAVTRTTASLANCFLDKRKQLLYPTLCR